MAHPHRSTSTRTGRTNERTAREVFFAMLGAVSICALFGIVAIGHSVS